MNKPKVEWWAKIREGLVRDPDAPHYRKMGNALWVYLNLHMGADLETGQLFRTYKTISNETGIPEPTVRKMMKTLQKGAYIKTVRMARGLHIQITKWGAVKKKKRVSKSGLSESRVIVQISKSDRPNQNIVSKSGRSPSGQKEKINPARVSKSGRSNETLNETQIYIGVFEFWNAQKIIVHREPERFKSCVNARLKLYTAEELCQGIKNYADILNSPDHFFSYRWTLSDFLGRKNGIDRFMDQEAAFKNFRKNGSSTSPPEPPPETEEERQAKTRAINENFERYEKKIEGATS